MVGNYNFLSIGHLLTIVVVIQYVFVSNHLAKAQTKSTRNGLMQLFKAELFLNSGDDLNSGLYEGMVKGRRRFGGTQKPHGFGMINYFTNDKFHRKNYTGYWKDGTRHGNGTTYFRDGSIYRGEYFDGLEEGQGEISYPNGNVLSGQFEDGKIHGHTVLRYANGDQREGFFRENELDGQVIFTMDNGQTIIELWKNGKRVEDADQVIEIDENTTIPTVDPRKNVETIDKVKNADSIDTKGKSTEDESTTTTARTPILLDKLRTAIRSGDKSVLFSVDNEKSKLQQNRRPKFTQSGEDTLTFIKNLRKETEKSNKNFLMSVFSRVNGDVNGKRRKRNTKYMIRRKIDTKSR